MKNLLILVVVAWWPVAGRGQVVDGIEIDKQPGIQYAMVNVANAGKFGKTMYRISIDYGQKTGGSQNFTILDENGDARLWYSHIEVLNYMYGFGWELMYKTLTPMIGTNTMLDSYVFKRAQGK